MEGFDFTQLMNYGALGTCLVYFIWKDNNSMKELRNTLTDLRELIVIMKEGKCKVDG